MVEKISFIRLINHFNSNKPQLNCGTLYQKLIKRMHKAVENVKKYNGNALNEREIFLLSFERFISLRIYHNFVKISSRCCNSFVLGHKKWPFSNQSFVRRSNNQKIVAKCLINFNDLEIQKKTFIFTMETLLASPRSLSRDSTPRKLILPSVGQSQCLPSKQTERTG